MEQYYNYHPVTFESLGSNDMEYSPLDGELAPPADSTVHPSPALAENEAAVFDKPNDKWNVVPDYREEIYYLITDGSEVIFNLGESPDSTMQTTIPTAILLERTKETKRKEIRVEFYNDCLNSVVVDTISYHGGIDSAYRLDGALRLTEKASLTEVSFTDVNNVAHVLTIAQANVIILAVGQDYQTKFMNKQQKMVDIESAADEVAVNLIQY